MTTDLDFLFEKLLDESKNIKSAPIFCVAYKTNVKKPKLFFGNDKINDNQNKNISLEKNQKNMLSIY